MKKSIILVIWIVILQTIGYAMGNITEANLDPWYLSLNKSFLTPPGYIFGIVWSGLYLLLAIVGWQLFQDKKIVNLNQLQLTFVVQLILNWLWTPLFFYLHWIGIALVCLIVIVWFTTLFLIFAWRQQRLLFWLMFPYWCWVCFALYLNFFIWHGNP